MAEDKYTIGKQVDLKAEQAKTLAGVSLPANLILKGMFLTFDLVYGAQRTLPKFMVLEMLARYPYWAWENAAYQELSVLYSSGKSPCEVKTGALLELVRLGRESQDNEQWHLFLLADIVRQKGIKLSWFHYCLIPRIMAFKYGLIVKILYWINPAWSFAMNAAFESHAERQYMLMSRENPEWDKEAVTSKYFEFYPAQKTLGDLVRRIGLDERDHMNRSLDELKKSCKA